jgi:hypothetical protein
VSGNTNNPVHYTLYPLTLFHPVLGGVTAQDQDTALRVFQPHHDWFLTAAEADAHRTDREAQMVIHNTRRMQVDDMATAYDAVASGDPDANAKLVEAHQKEEGDDSPVPARGTVVHSVTHTENWVKPMIENAKKTDADKQAENEAAEQAAHDRHADDADVQHVVVEPSDHTVISG